MKEKQIKFIDLDERGKTTEYCRALHAKMGSYIGNGMKGGQMPKHRGETSGALIIYEEDVHRHE